MGTTSNINPYALYVHCDAAMDYDSINSGGIGIEIVFPDTINLELLNISLGRYTGANIERLEIEAIIQGMNKVIDLFSVHQDQLSNVRTVIITTDRFGLNDQDKTSPFKIKEWRHNNWHNHEGKPIKNSDLLERVDKARRKLISRTNCSVHIDYRPSKYNRTADRLSKQGKRITIMDNSISLNGIKIGKRRYDGDEITYNLLNSKDNYDIHVFKKEFVRDQWEVQAEFTTGIHFGKKIKIYVSQDTENKLHRHHIYNIRVKSVFRFHITIYKTFREISIHQLLS